MIKGSTATIPLPAGGPAGGPAAASLILYDRFFVHTPAVLLTRTTHAVMDLQGVTFAVAIAFLVLSWLAVGLRSYVRFRMLHSWGIDDWFMLLTVVSARPQLRVRGGKHLRMASSRLMR